jgi:hypothetical protein
MTDGDGILWCGNWTAADKEALKGWLFERGHITTPEAEGNAMSTEHAEIFARLAAPFASHEVKVRQQAGRQLHYITARVAMNRLDQVLGPENWWDDYIPGEHSVLCRLTICLPDGKVLTKCDAGGYAGMSDQGDDDKSGFSDAFKRACVKFGVGRYLYRDGVPEFVPGSIETMPVLDSGPRQITPGVPQPGPRPAPSPDDHTPAEERRDYGDKPPRSGRALFAWTKDMEARHEVGLLQYLNKWGKLQDYPGRMVDWDADQVANAYQEARRKLASAAVGEDADIDRAAARDAG